MKGILWNLFLAFVPVVLAVFIDLLDRMPKRSGMVKAGMVVLGLVWLAFLPNTCYLLTEWRHFLAGLDASNLYLRSQFDNDTTLRLMKYTVFYFCYSGIGMITYTLAIRPIARVFRQRGATVWVWGLPLFLMLSIGVYLGLILRYNSWDLATRPGIIWDSVVEIFSRPRLTAVILAFGAFLWLAYTAIDIWIDGFLGRLYKRGFTEDCS